MVRIIFNVLLYLYKELKHYAEGIARGHAPKLNEICIARFPDGKWCRAACKNVISNAAGTIYNCIQVDYGATHFLGIDFIRQIPRRFVEFLPLQAHRALLEGTENIHQQSPELVGRLDELLPVNSLKTLSIVRRQVNGIVRTPRETLIVRMPDVRAILSKELWL